MYQKCIFCGRKKEELKVGEKITKDHIPPKHLFAKPRPNLISVPSCNTCHKKTKKDDEYFGLVMSLREDVYYHPEVQKRHKKIAKQVTRKEAKRFISSIVNNINDVNLYSKSGLIYLGKKPAFDVDYHRIYNVINRIVRGLFYIHTNKMLPLDYIVESISPEDLIELNLKGISNVLGIIEEFKKREVITIGNNIFQYKYIITEDNTFASVWLMKFYDRVIFQTFTLPS